MRIAQTIKQKALDIGFDAAGITSADPPGPMHIDFLRQWLTEGMQADMTYLNRNIEKRTNPAELMPGAKSVICAAVNYKPPQIIPPTELKQFGEVSDYAIYNDYHRIIKKMLWELADYITTLPSCRNARFKACVDSAPLLERALAERAGLGFIGKNKMLINPEFGPAVLLGELLTDVELPADRPIEENCGNCRLCIDTCPTKALTEKGLDARKCLSCHTIENKDEIPHSIAEKIGTSLFGCDRCVKACPCFQNAPAADSNVLKPTVSRKYIELNRLLEMTEEQFSAEFSDTPMARTGLEKLKITARQIIYTARD